MRIIICSVKHMGTFGQCLGIAGEIARYNARSNIPTHIGRSSVPRTLLSQFTPVSLYNDVDVILSCGATGERRARRLLRFRQPAIWAHIELPDQDRADEPNLVFVSNHDWLPEYNSRTRYRQIHGVPHRIRREEIAAARKGVRERLKLSRENVVAVLLGGPNPAFCYDDEAIAKVVAAIQESATQAMVLVTVSRRSDLPMIQALRDMKSENIHILTTDSPFSYFDMLAAADSLLVTEDSISMTCEALATGKPVQLLSLTPVAGARLQKFRRFQHHFIEELNVLQFYNGNPFPEGMAPNNIPDDRAAVAQEILNYTDR